MLYLLILLQLADIATTHYVLRTGIGTEANPVLRRLFDKFGHERVLLVSKGAFIAFLLAVQHLLPAWALGFMTAFYVWVVANNVNIIREARKNERH